MALAPEVSREKEIARVEGCENASDVQMGTIPKSGTDDALQMALASQGETWTEEEERWVLWKIDLAIAPLVRSTMSANSITSARLAVLKKHTYIHVPVVPWYSRELRR